MSRCPAFDRVGRAVRDDRAMSSPWPRRILVAVDTSHESVNALDRALELAATTGAVVVAVHAVGLLEEGAIRPAPDVAGILAEAQRRTGCPPDRIAAPVIEHGPAALTILRVAENEGVDLITVGNRGLGAAEASLGSTTTAIVDRANVPVLVVQRDPEPTPLQRD
jgi:nucleotide-binding universal stress UspA family protein